MPEYFTSYALATVHEMKNSCLVQLALFYAAVNNFMRQSINVIGSHRIASRRRRQGGSVSVYGIMVVIGFVGRDQSHLGDHYAIPSDNESETKHAALPYRITIASTCSLDNVGKSFRMGRARYWGHTSSLLHFKQTFLVSNDPHISADRTTGLLVKLMKHY